MKKLVLLFSLVLTCLSHAADPSPCKSPNEKGLKRCLKKALPAMKKAGEAPKKDCSPDHGSSHCPPLGGSFAENCDNFISARAPDCYGGWGREIASYLKEKGGNSVFFTHDLSSACRKWKTLSLKQKENVIVWIMASIADVESSCDAGERNSNASNGVAVGLLQLDERPSARSWRGPNCKSKSVSSAAANLRCGLDILEDLLQGRSGNYKGNGQLWGSGSNSYWQHLRKKDGGEIADNVLSHPLCR